MLSILKNKEKNHIPDSVWKIFEEPGNSKNKIRAKIFSATDVLLVEFEQANIGWKFNGTAMPQNTGEVSYVVTTFYWAEQRTWYNIPDADWTWRTPLIRIKSPVQFIITVRP